MRLRRRDGSRVLSGSGEVGFAAHGQRHPLLPGIERNRPIPGGATRHPRLSPKCIRRTPKLLERAGPGLEAGHARTGQITGLFTVLVEGDDHNEPVADAVRGILDGHIVMERRIAESGRYPAIDVLRSLSRLASSCLNEQQTALVRRARSMLSLHADMIDMVRLGAYRAGTDAAVDEAIRLTPVIESILRQGRHDRSSFGQAFAQLAAILGAPNGT
jgi:flagellum-specific ATP synthase